MLVKFEVYFDGEHWCARGIGVSIFTQGKTLDELMDNIKEATSLHFEDALEAGEEIKVLSIFGVRGASSCESFRLLAVKSSLRCLEN